MKKILFASTALVATAGVAAADVSFGGYGRFGIGYSEDRGDVAGQEDIVLVHRFRMNIDASAETDGGVVFDARVRMQGDEQPSNSVVTSTDSNGDVTTISTASGGESGSVGLNGARFGVEFGGLRVEAGNIAGAIDNLPNYYGSEPGLENFVGQYTGADYGFAGYDSTGNGVNGVYARYAIGDFAVAMSYDSNDDYNATTAAFDGNDRWDVHAAYTFGGLTAAVAYGENDVDEDITVLTLGGTWGGLSATALIGDETVADADASDLFYGVSGAFDLTSATTLTASYGDGSGSADVQSYGVGVIHDLGGGVSLRGGIGESDDTMKADFGAFFNF